MTTKKSNESEIKTIYNQKLKKYFKDYFMGKNAYNSMIDRIREGTLKLTGAYIDFCLLCDCLDIIINNDKFPKKYKKIIRTTLIGVDTIRADIEQIVTQISDKMTN